jgi:sugar lactone lactonase YvrE
MNTRLDVAVACVVDARCTLGESPVWAAREGGLYWADIEGCALHHWRPADGVHRSWSLPSKLGSLGLCADDALILALKHGIHRFDVMTEALSFIAHPEAAQPGFRYNDGKVSPDGRLWVGTMDEDPERKPLASLYRLDAEGISTTMVSGLRVSNGLAWSPDGRTMYHCDSRVPQIWRHAYDPADGSIGPREVFAEVDPAWGRPDGAAVDVEGCYWSAGIGAGRVNRFAPDGRLIGHVELPVTHPTMPCFGGTGLRTMYITSLRHGLAPDVLARTPQAGSVFAVDVGVAGVPISCYGS